MGLGYGWDYMKGVGIIGGKGGGRVILVRGSKEEVLWVGYVGVEGVGDL
jgi:hypothetical protein